MSKILPEVCHDYIEMSMEEVHAAYATGTTITGLVESIDIDSQQVNVRLGQDILAKLPFSEVTIYPFRYSKKLNTPLPTNIKSILDKKIRAKIINIADNVVTISRKKNMQEAYAKLSTCKQATMCITEIIPKSVFGDVGEGVDGKMFIREICKAHIKSAREYFHKGQIIEVALLGTDEQKRLVTSYKQTFPPYRKEDYIVGMIVRGKIADWIKITQISSYYIYITPQVSGIMNINQRVYFPYGAEVECIVTGISDKGLYLSFSRLPN